MHPAQFNIDTLARYRHCYFLLRSDHKSHPGGDVDLARQLGRAAEAAGANVSVVDASGLPAALGAEDILVLFNIDRPFDAALALDRASPETRVLLYALHHPSDGVRKYLARASGVKRVLGLASGGRPDRYEAIVDAAKALRTGSTRRMAVALRRKQVIESLIARCELLVTSDSELAQIRARLGEPQRDMWLLPHPNRSRECRRPG